MIIETYSSLKEKSVHFDSVLIDNKNDLDNLIKEWTQKDNDKTIIFRGLTEAKYKLVNSAQRFWNGEELNKLGRSYQDFIQNEIDNAKAFHNNLLIKFYNAFGHVAYDFSILSFLQHYKAPTPLLDFTYNFDCALFFGIDGLSHYPSEDINNYFSIYAINTKEGEFYSITSHLESSISQIDDILSSYGKDVDTTEALNEIGSLKYRQFESLKLFYLPGYIKGGIAFTIANRPNFKLVYNQHNLNVINQEGLFVFNSDPTHPLEDYFNDYKNNEAFQSPYRLPKIKCWNIHKSLSEYVVRYLTEGRAIPIDKEFIYPQEEHIASSAFKRFKNFS